MDSSKEATSAEALLSIDSAIFKGVRVSLRARLGEATMSVEDLLALTAGSVVTLDTAMNQPVDLLLNDDLVARGEIVAVGDNFGVRLTEVAKVS